MRSKSTVAHRSTTAVVRVLRDDRYRTTAGSERRLARPQGLLFYRVNKVMTTPAHKQGITTVKSPLPEVFGNPAGTRSHQDAQLVLRLHKRLGSWEAIADALGYSPAFWWKVSQGKIKRLLPKGLRRCLASSDPKLLRLVLQGAVPYLQERER